MRYSYMIIPKSRDKSRYKKMNGKVKAGNLLEASMNLVGSLPRGLVEYEMVIYRKCGLPAAGQDYELLIANGPAGKRGTYS